MCEVSYDINEHIGCCPTCESYDSIEFCNNYGAVMDAQYISDLLYDDDFEWSDKELNVILEYLEEYN